ncbi:MAG: hypothetical protein M1831_007098 [Alyxoria varia]|nr:MAG: hypothetical protein M1831_007098 [Alyxoria varia]
MARLENMKRMSLSRQVLEEGLLEYLAQEHENAELDYECCVPTLYCYGLILPPILPSFLDLKEMAQTRNAKKELLDHHNINFHRIMRRDYRPHWTKDAIHEALEELSSRFDAHMAVIATDLEHCRLWLEEPSRFKTPSDIPTRRSLDCLTDEWQDTRELRPIAHAGAVSLNVYRGDLVRRSSLESYPDHRTIGPIFESKLLEEPMICWILGRDGNEFYSDPKNWVPMSEKFQARSEFKHEHLAVAPIDDSESCQNPDFKYVLLDKSIRHGESEVEIPYVDWPNDCRPSKQSLYLHFVVSLALFWRMHKLNIDPHPALFEESSDPWNIWPTTQPYLRKSFVRELAALVELDESKIRGTFADGSDSDYSNIQLRSRDAVREVAMAVVHRTTQMRIQPRLGCTFVPDLRLPEELAASDLDDDEVDDEGNAARAPGERECPCVYHVREEPLL